MGKRDVKYGEKHLTGEMVVFNASGTAIVLNQKSAVVLKKGSQDGRRTSRRALAAAAVSQFHCCQNLQAPLRLASLEAPNRATALHALSRGWVVLGAAARRLPVPWLTVRSNRPVDLAR
jgi:hypothetical protein